MLVKVTFTSMLDSVTISIQDNPSFFTLMLELKLIWKKWDNWILNKITVHSLGQKHVRTEPENLMLLPFGREGCKGRLIIRISIKHIAPIW
jgi:hypothetical protein